MCELYLHVLIYHGAVTSYRCVAAAGIELKFKADSLSFVLCVMCAAQPLQGGWVLKVEKFVQSVWAAG